MSAISTTPLGIKTLLAIRNRTTLHPHPVLNSSGKGIDLGVIFLAKIPLGDRLDCLAQLPHLVTPRYLPDFSSLKVFWAIARKYESLVNLQTIIQQAADQTFYGNQLFSEGFAL
jgi:hypothetical protein